MICWKWKAVANVYALQDEVAAARPDIDEKTSQLVSKGRWAVPGYKVRNVARFASQCINQFIGEIRRPLRALSGFESFLFCTVQM